MTRPGPWLRAWRVIMAATGVHASLVPLGLAAAVTVIWRDGMIVAVGPLTLAAKLPVVVAVATLLAVACGISHVSARTPVIVRNARTVAARAISHLTVLGASMVLVLVGDLLNPASTAGAATRNLMLLSSAALLAAALAGPAYAWIPVIVLFGTGVLSSPDESTWSVYALLMAPQAQPVQVVATVLACLVAVLVAASDPRGLAYLPAPPRPAARGRRRSSSSADQA